MALLAAAALPGHAAPPPPVFPPLIVLTEQSPPASMQQEGKIIGHETEKVVEMLKRTGISYKLDILPWKRGFTMAQRDANTCIYSTTRTPEREKLFKWIGPTYEADWSLVGRTDRQLNLRTLEDARPLRIGTYNGDARDEYLRARLQCGSGAERPFESQKADAQPYRRVGHGTAAGQHGAGTVWTGRQDCPAAHLPQGESLPRLQPIRAGCDGRAHEREP